MNIRKIWLLFAMALPGCLMAQMREGGYQALKADKENTVTAISVNVVPLGNGILYFHEGGYPRKPLSGTYRITVNRREYCTGNFKKGFADGDWERHRDDRLLEKRSVYKNGVLDGKFIRFRESGKEEYVYTYENGRKRHYISYHPGGKIREEQFYDEDEHLHGEMFTYDEDGKTVGEKRYQHGRRQGMQVETDQDGYKVSQAYVDNKKCGIYSKLYPDGSLCEQGSFDEQGKKNGLWTIRNKDGRLKTEEHYLNGQLDGERQEYYAGEKLKSKENYVAGKLHGLKIEYDEDPHKVSREMMYSEGNLHGTFKVWHNGILWREGAYQDRELIYEKEYADGKLQIVKLLDENRALIPVEKYDSTGKRTYKKTDYRRHPTVVLKENASGVIDVEIK